MTIYKIGVVGGGIYGSQMLKCFANQQNMGRVELVAVADLDEDILARHAEAFGTQGFTNYTAMMAETNLDAVAIATPDHLHFDIIETAATAGLHIISQKPLDVNIERTERIINICEAAQVLLYVDFHKRFDPAHIRLKQDVVAGRLGKLQYGHVHMEDKIIVPTVWLKKWAASSSPSWFLGTHFYDLLFWLTGQLPRRVLASGYKGKLESLGLVGAWDSIQAKVEYETGFSVTYDLSWILPNSFPSIVNQGIRLVGEEGIAEVDSQDRGYFSAYGEDAGSIITNPFGAFETNHPIFGNTTEGYTFKSMTFFIDLLQALGDGMSIDELKGSYPNANDALVSTRIGCAIDESLSSGKLVNIAK